MEFYLYFLKKKVFTKNAEAYICVSSFANTFLKV